MYNQFANVYDFFNEEADYDALFEAVHSRLLQHGVRDGIVAELTLRLAAAGYDMIGVDLSPEMLSVLREKAQDAADAGDAGSKRLLLLNQDLTQLDLYGTVQAAVCTFDTLNHIGPAARFAQAVQRAALFIEPGGVFVFDMNTPYKHAHVLGNHTFTLKALDGTCVWKNHYDNAQARTEISITVSDADGALFTEEFWEYSYTLAQVEDACAKAGLRIESVQDGETFGPLEAKSQRFFVTAVKLEGQNP